MRVYASYIATAALIPKIIYTNRTKIFQVLRSRVYASFYAMAALILNDFLEKKGFYSNAKLSERRSDMEFAPALLLRWLHV